MPSENLWEIPLIPSSAGIPSRGTALDNAPFTGIFDE